MSELLEPPIGTLVTDKNDDEWKRAPYGWTFELRPGVWDSGPGAGISWADLVKHYGPVKVVEP